MADRNPQGGHDGGKRDDISRMAVVVAMLFDLFANPEDEKGTAADRAPEADTGEDRREK